MLNLLERASVALPSEQRLQEEMTRTLLAQRHRLTTSKDNQELSAADGRAKAKR